MQLYGFDMDLFFYSKCQTQTKRAMRHRGRRFNYVPRHELIVRLAKETGWTYAEVKDLMIAESKFLRSADEIYL